MYFVVYGGKKKGCISDSRNDCDYNVAESANHTFITKLSINSNGLRSVIIVFVNRVPFKDAVGYRLWVKINMFSDCALTSLEAAIRSL